MINRSRRQSEFENKPTRYFSTIQEKQIAKKLNGSRQANSGATPFQKGDVKLEDILVECKTKTSSTDSFSIKRSWLEKNNQEALFMGKKFGVLAFNFGPGQENYYILKEEDFLDMLNRYKEID